MTNINTPSTILKTAVKENEIAEKNYIICKRVVTTGFDWVIIKDEDGNKKTYEHCNIFGADPFNELNLNTDFIFGDNMYIFYVDERFMYNDGALSDDILGFNVIGWDILYPIKRNLNPFASKKYITIRDVNKSIE